jgi:regulator of sirC expression with transglutaminase-like and TPR domain
MQFWIGKISVTDAPDPLGRLADALAAEEEDPGLLALLLAARFYPALDIAGYLTRLDDLAARAKTRLGRAHNAARVIAAINAVLFEEEGFFGNVVDYYNPLNIFLNEVMDRRAGIPISLSVLYLAVARRMGQPIVGVGLPLHFIVKHAGKGEDIYVDPFHSGRILTVPDCQAQVESSYGAPVHFHESYLDSVPTRMILYRMLNNLKHIYLRLQDYRCAGMVIEQMLVVRPDQAEEVRDRGLLFLQERRCEQAVEYLTRYLHDNPEAPDADLVRRRMQDAFDSRARRN